MRVEVNGFVFNINEEEVRKIADKTHRRLTKKFRSEIEASLIAAQIQSRAKSYALRGGDFKAHITRLGNAYFQVTDNLEGFREIFIGVFSRALAEPMRYIIEEFYRSYEAAFGKTPPDSMVDDLMSEKFDTQLIVEFSARYHRSSYYASLKHPTASEGIADEQNFHRNSLIMKSRNSEKDGKPVRPEGAYNILALFNHGWHAKRYAYGVWEPTEPRSGSSDGKVIRGRKDFRGLFFVEHALRRFNAQNKGTTARIDPDSIFLK